MISPKVIYGGHPESPEVVRARVLDALCEGETVPRRALNVRVMGSDRWGAGATYAALGFLRQEGLVERTWAGYRITDRGLAARGKKCR